MKSKELFQALFNKQEVARPLYIPLICSFAAKLRQVTVPKLFSDPTVYANSLRDAYRLFGFDAMVTSFDPTLEAEALGCGIQWEQEDQLPRVVSHPLAEGQGFANLEREWEKKGRIPVVMEATKRLTMLLSKEAAIIGTIAGPFTLAAQLRGDPFFTELREDTPYCNELINFAGQCGLKLANLYSELNVDGLFVIENHFHKIKNISSINKLASALRPFSNLLEHFGIPLILLARGCSKEQIALISILPAKGLILDIQPDEHTQNPDRCIAATVPSEQLLDDAGLFRETLDNLLEEGHFFLSNDWEIPYHTPVPNIYEIMKRIKNSE